MKHELPDTEHVEVVLRKQMTMAEYRSLLAGQKTKGWRVQAYQLEKYNEGMNQEIKSE